MSAPETSTTAKLVAAGIFSTNPPVFRQSPNRHVIELTLAELEAALAKGQAEEAEHSRKVEGALKRANEIGRELDRQIEWLSKQTAIIIGRPRPGVHWWAIAWPAEGSVGVAHAGSFAKTLAQASAPE